MIGNKIQSDTLVSSNLGFGENTFCIYADLVIGFVKFIVSNSHFFEKYIAFLGLMQYFCIK